VGGSAERQIGSPEEPVVGGDAVAGGEHVGQAGSHLAIDDDRPFDAELSAGCGRELDVGTHTDRDEHDVGRESKRPLVRVGRMDLQRVRGARESLLDRLDPRAAKDVDLAAVELGADERPEFRVHCGEDFRELLHLRYSKRQGFGHLEPDVAGTDDDRAADLAVLERAHQRERVAHRVKDMHSLARAKTA
jgi:hypothetical protein